jgi:hypothetical protein
MQDNKRPCDRLGRFSRFEIDHQLVFGRLLDGKVAQ